MKLCLVSMGFILTIWGLPVQGQSYSMRWRPKEKSFMRYQIQVVHVIKSLSQETQEMKLETGFYLDWRILEIQKDGSTLETLMMSKLENSPDVEFLPGVSELWGKELRVEREPDMKVREVKSMETLSAEGQMAFEMIKQSAQMDFLCFPATPKAVGDKWEKDIEISLKIGPLQTDSYGKAYYTMTDVKTYKGHQVCVVNQKMDLEGRISGQASGVESKKTTGEIYVDLETGVPLYFSFAEAIEQVYDGSQGEVRIEIQTQMTSEVTGPLSVQ